MADEVRWFVRIDWASEQHQVCLLDADGHVVGERVFAHGGEGLAALCAWLVATTDDKPEVVAVWQDEHKRWQGRDLSAKRYVYVWADGVYFRPRLEHERKHPA